MVEEMKRGGRKNPGKGNSSREVRLASDWFHG
jgi:hypothetical protein